MRSDREHRTRALVDPLTGVLNRHALPQRVEEISQRAAIAAAPVGVIVIDIDGFKQINELYGHQAGDRVLREVVRRLSNRVRTSDAIHRVGGDEILVLLPGADLPEVQKIAGTMCQAVSSEPCEGVGVTISCGVSATTPGVPFDFRTQFDKADAALFSAKARGRNCSEPSSSPLPPADRQGAEHPAAPAR
jgi:two-component system cell cycle response regulator